MTIESSVLKKQGVICKCKVGPGAQTSDNYLCCPAYVATMLYTLILHIPDSFRTQILVYSLRLRRSFVPELFAATISFAVALGNSKRLYPLFNNLSLVAAVQLQLTLSKLFWGCRLCVDCVSSSCG